MRVGACWRSAVKQWPASQHTRWSMPSSSWETARWQCPVSLQGLAYERSGGEPRFPASHLGDFVW
jgi:hypothetical protein